MGQKQKEEEERRQSQCYGWGAPYLNIGGVVVEHSRYVLIREGARGVADQETSLA